MEKILIVKNMHCTSCESLITSSVKEINGVGGIKVSYKDETAKIEFNPDRTNINNIINTINDLGYSASIKNENIVKKESLLDKLLGRKIK